MFARIQRAPIHQRQRTGDLLQRYPQVHQHQRREAVAAIGRLVAEHPRRKTAHDLFQRRTAHILVAVHDNAASWPFISLIVDVRVHLQAVGPARAHDQPFRGDVQHFQALALGQWKHATAQMTTQLTGLRRSNCSGLPDLCEQRLQRLVAAEVYGLKSHGAEAGPGLPRRAPVAYPTASVFKALVKVIVQGRVIARFRPRPS